VINASYKYPGNQTNIPIYKQRTGEIVKYSIPLGRNQEAKAKDRSPDRGLPDNISTIEGTEMMEGPRDEELNNNDRDSSRNNDASSNNNNNNNNNNNKTATTVSAQSNEILNVNTANHNNIQKNGSTTTRCATQVPGNQAQQNPTTSTFHNTQHTHSENPTQNINTDDQSNYTPHKKTWSHF
jgi:hypothetical protein